jgi:hypothetical protein
MTKDQATRQEIAYVIEDILKPLMTAVRHSGMVNGDWDIYAIEVAVKSADHLGIIQIHARVKWPNIAAATINMKKVGPEINLADPKSYPLIRHNLVKLIDKGDGWPRGL